MAGSSSTSPYLNAPERLTALRATGLLGGEPSAPLDRLTRLAARLLGVPVALVSLVDDESQWFVGRAGLTGRAAQRRRAPLTHSLCRHVVAGREALVVDDAAEHPLGRDTLAIPDLDVRAYAGVPLTTAAGHTVGAFCAIDTAPRAWTGDDLACLRDLAASAASEIELRTVAAALAESEEHHRAAAEFSPQVRWTAGPRGEFEELAERWLALTGVAREGARGGGWADAVHPEDRAPMLAAWERAVAAGEPFAFEHRLRLTDGRYRWVCSRARPRRAADGRVVRWYGTTEDVDERVLARREHARFALLARAAADGSWSWDVVTGEVFHSERYRELLGFTEAEFPGTIDAFFDALHPDDRERVREAVRAHLARRAPFDVEFRMRVKDGSYRWFWDRGQAAWDDAGRTLRMAGSISDVTDRRRAEAALRESESRYRALLRHYPDGAVFLADHDLRLLVADGQALAAAGFDPAAVTGRRLDEVLPPDVAGEVALMYRTALAGQEQTFTLARGGRVYENRALPVRDDAGGVVAGMVISRDVTERARADAEREVLEAQLRQAQKMEAVGQLAGGVAHDFNNLLTVILGNLEFARGDLPDGLPAGHPLRGDLDEVLTAAERARTLVRQLLAFSRKRTVQPRRVHVGEVVRGAASLLRRVIGEEIVLEVVVADALPAVRIDPGQLDQLLMNLAVNARDAMLTPRHGTAGGGGTLLVEATARAIAPDDAGAGGVPPGPAVQLVVRDSGHGMDEATRARAFEPFFTTKEAGLGTGIGLATVLGIVRQAGGAVRLDSAPGAGTSVTILLPADATEDDDDPVPAAAAAPAARATVLVVEDEAAVRVTARRMLERRGYVVLEARHGADALLLWREQGARVDAVVTDLRMPELGGRHLVETLRADAPGLPVVYASGYSDQRPAPSPHGCDVFLEKPFGTEGLLAAVERVLRARPPAAARGD